MNELEVAGMKVSMDPKTATARITMAGGAYITKQGVEVVLLFGILAALTKTPEKSKKPLRNQNDPE